VKETSDGAAGIRRSSVIGGVALLAILLGGMAVFFLAGGDPTPIAAIGLSAEQIADTIRSWGTWAMIGSVLLMVVHSLVPFPSELIAIANGIVFGTVVGTIITWIGAMLGASLAFALSRWLGRRFVQAILPARHTTAIDEWTKDQGTQVLLVSHPAGGVVQSHQLRGRAHLGLMVDISLDYRPWHRAPHIPDGVRWRADNVRKVEACPLSDCCLRSREPACVSDRARAQDDEESLNVNVRTQANCRDRRQQNQPWDLRRSRCQCGRRRLSSALASQ
jgi:hypothetical protein